MISTNPVPNRNRTIEPAMDPDPESELELDLQVACPAPELPPLPTLTLWVQRTLLEAANDGIEEDLKADQRLFSQAR